MGGTVDTLRECWGRPAVIVGRIGILTPMGIEAGVVVPPLGAIRSIAS